MLHAMVGLRAIGGPRLMRLRLASLVPRVVLVGEDADVVALVVEGI